MTEDIVDKQYFKDIEDIRKKLYNEFEESIVPETEIYNQLIQQIDEKYNEKYQEFSKIRDEKIAEADKELKLKKERAERIRDEIITSEIRDSYRKDKKTYEDYKKRVWETFEEITYPDIVKSRELFQKKIKENDSLVNYVKILRIFDEMYPLIKDEKEKFEIIFDQNIVFDSESADITEREIFKYYETIKEAELIRDNISDSAKIDFDISMKPIISERYSAKTKCINEYNNSIADKRKIYEDSLLNQQDEYVKEYVKIHKIEKLFTKTNEFGMV